MQLTRTSLFDRMLGIQSYHFMSLAEESYTLTAALLFFI